MPRVSPYNFRYRTKHPRSGCSEMRKQSDNIDIVRFQRASDLDGLEFLRATFVRHSFPRHTHETFAIGVIEQGVQATRYNSATHIATSGEICLVNPGEVHTGYSPHEAGWTYRVFYPDAALLQKVAGAVIGREQGVPHFSSPVIKDRQLAWNILLFLKALDTSAITMERESLLLSVLGRMIRGHGYAGGGKPVGRHTDGRGVKAAREYLDARFTGNVTLADLSKATQLSEFHLLRQFRDAVGLPPHAYLVQKRIDLARRLLSQGLSIAQVSLETGFVDQSHFTRRFRNIVGITPGDYRRGSNFEKESHQ